MATNVSGVNDAAKMQHIYKKVDDSGGEKPQNGTLKGQNVIVRDPGSGSNPSMIEDAAEQGGAAFANRLKKNKTTEKKSNKTESKSGEEDSVDDEENQGVDKSKEIHQYNKLTDDNKNKDPFFEHRNLKEEYSNLKDERDNLLEATAPQDRAKIQDQLDTLNLKMAKLYTNNKKLIDSGGAIDPAVQATLADFKNRSIDINEVDIHSNYRDIHSGYKDGILDHGTVKETYTKIVETYTEEYFEEGLGTLISALSKDLARFNTQLKGSVSDKIQLKLIMQDIYKLKNLQTFYLKCTELLGGFTTEKVSMGFLVQKCLELLEKSWVESADIEKIVTIVDKSPKGKVGLGFLNRMLTAVKSVPIDNTYATGIDGANTELFDVINEVRNYKAEEANEIPTRTAGKT